MSEPTRYTGKAEGSVLGSPHWEHPEGEWVKWEDYARLKAEVERLTKERDKALTDFWCIHEGYFRLQAELNRLTAFTTRTIIPNEELQAQVERLTKAGDNMYYWLGVCGRHNNSTGDDWLRAKKGLPSLSEQWEIEKRNRAGDDASKEGKPRA